MSGSESVVDTLGHAAIWAVLDVVIVAVGIALLYALMRTWWRRRQVRWYQPAEPILSADFPYTDDDIDAMRGELEEAAELHWSDVLPDEWIQ